MTGLARASSVYGSEREAIRPDCRARSSARYLNDALGRPIAIGIAP